jgi:hypothetical protein
VVHLSHLRESDALRQQQLQTLLSDRLLSAAAGRPLPGLRAVGGARPAATSRACSPPRWCWARPTPTAFTRATIAACSSP